MPIKEHDYGPKRVTKKIPGPKAQKIIKRDHKVMSPSNPHGYGFVMDRGEGCLVYDVDGNRYIDLAAGIAVSSTGYQHPKVTEAIKNQVDDYLHICSAVFYNKIQTDYAERLAKMTKIKGRGRNRVFFGNSGAEAWEAALKLARYHTGRKNFIAFYNCFHGRTFGSIVANASKIYQRKGFGPFMPGFFHAFYPRPFKCPSDAEYPTSFKGCLDYINDIVFQKLVDPSEVAAIALEPIQGEGGYVVPPKAFVQGLREICDKHGILLISDEVQAGMGRTGKLFCMENYGIEPDIICTAKGIASGMPLSAMIAKEKIMSWPSGAHGTTFGGNPVSMAAAQATLDLLEDGLMKNADKIGKVFMKRMKPWIKKYKSVGDVRGIGLMIGIEIIQKGKKGVVLPDAKKRDAIIDKLFEAGLIVLPCGSNTIRLCPPLTITKQQAELACDIIESVIKNQG